MGGCYKRSERRKAFAERNGESRLAPANGEAVSGGDRLSPRCCRFGQDEFLKAVGTHPLKITRNLKIKAKTSDFSLDKQKYIMYNHQL